MPTKDTSVHAIVDPNLTLASVPLRDLCRALRLRRHRCRSCLALELPQYTCVVHCPTSSVVGRMPWKAIFVAPFLFYYCWCRCSCCSTVARCTLRARSVLHTLLYATTSQDQQSLLRLSDVAVLVHYSIAERSLQHKRMSRSQLAQHMTVAQTWP